MTMMYNTNIFTVHIYETANNNLKT